MVSNQERNCDNCAYPLHLRVSTYCGKCLGDDYCMFEPKKGGVTPFTYTLPRIVAVDFDGCLFEDKWPDIGAPIYSTIERLKEEQRNGSKTVLWTCRKDKILENAVQACAEQGLIFDAVNGNVPEIISAFGDTRKIYADEYWDDRAIKMPLRPICPICGSKDGYWQLSGAWTCSNGDAHPDTPQGKHTIFRDIRKENYT